MNRHPEEPENSFTISITRHKNPVCGAIGQYTRQKRHQEQKHRPFTWRSLWFPLALAAAIALSLIIREIVLRAS